MWGRIDGLRVLDLGTPGPLRAELNGLVLSGAKTATAGLMESDYRAEGEDLELVGEHLVLVDDHGGRVGEVSVTSVEVVAFSAVTWEFAQAEGEGFRSVEHWREVHRRYWAGEGQQVDDETEVVCLHFRLVTAS
ncbi:ASCH domain-containing protein [Nonomuraea sp. NPDC050394]|uniref:ASCH domain-containing protein n=1 Tax=Nonomuraea sp. NPDC050394 TaxID=3364363 RepID=UPI00378F8C33